MTLKYLSAPGFPGTALQLLSSQWPFTSEALVQNIKKGTQQTSFLCFKDCDFVKLDPVVYSGESHWLQQMFKDGFELGPGVLKLGSNYHYGVRSRGGSVGLLPVSSQMRSWTDRTGRCHRTSEVTQTTFSVSAGRCSPVFKKVTGFFRYILGKGSVEVC